MHGGKHCPGSRAPYLQATMSEPTETEPTSEAPTFTHWRCRQCGTVCLSNEPLAELAPDDYCYHCASTDLEGVDDSVPLSPEPDEGDVYWMRFVVPDTGEFVGEIAFAQRGEALRQAHTLAWHEAYRVASSQAVPYWLIDVCGKEGIIFSSATDVHRCEGCERINIKPFEGETCSCGTPYPIAAPGPRSRESSLAG